MSARDVLAREAQHYQKCAGCMVACRASPQRPPHPVDGCGCMNIADAAISALRAAGYAVVPAEPDCDMLQAGYAAGRAARSSGVGGMTIDNQIKMKCYRESDIYRAMLAAAQETPDAP